MTCYHPLHGFKLGFKNSSTGKDVIRILPGTIDKISIYDKAIIKDVHDIPLEGDHIKKELQLVFFNGRKVSNYSLVNPIDIACGKCIGCRLAYSKDWAVRIVKECEAFKFNYFITLTYDNVHLKSKSLIKKDLQDFFKRLRSFYHRKFNHDNIRYFACGEYGEKFSRPHYHCCIFNIPIPDLKCIAVNFRGDKYYSSDIINSIWNKGYITIGELNFQTASYTARYCTKKIIGPAAKDFYKSNGIIPEFVVMSRKPGIGRNFYDQNCDKIYDNDSIYCNSGGKLIVAKPSRYYDNLYDIDHSDRLEVIKSRRRFVSDISVVSKLNSSSFKSKKRLLEYEEFLKNSQVSKLIRSKI